MICSYSECDNEFTPGTHNQIYCSDECCKQATNAKIMERYYRKKARRNGTNLQCSECKQQTLSRYSDNEVCSSCRNAKKRRQDETIARRLKVIQW